MFISFGHVSKKMLIPLFIPLIYLIRHYILENVNNKSAFMNTTIASLSYSFNILPFIIESHLIKSKKKEKQETTFDNLLLIEKKKIEIKKRVKQLIFLLLISLYNYFNFQVYDIAQIFQPKDYKHYYFYSISITVFFLSVALMSFLLLNNKIYKHQKISMLISLILSILMFTVFIKESGFHFDIIIYLIICLILRNLRFILMVFGKLYMEKLYVTQFKLLSFFGIVGLFFSIFANFIDFSKITGNDSMKNIFCYWNVTNKKLFFFSIIFWFFENNLIWFCISFFSPNHYLIFRNISSILVILYDLASEKGIFDYKTIISFFALIGIFICGLIFNEIIIIRIFKLEKDTAEELYKRQKEEYEKNNIDNCTDDSKNVYSSEISDTNIGIINDT